MNPHPAEQDHLSLISGCLLTAMGRGSQPARTLTALIPGNKTCSIGRDLQQENPSTRPFTETHLCDGRSYVLLKQRKGCVLSRGPLTASAKHWRRLSEVPSPPTPFTCTTSHGSTQIQNSSSQSIWWMAVISNSPSPSPSSGGSPLLKTSLNDLYRDSPKTLFRK